MSIPITRMATQEILYLYSFVYCKEYSNEFFTWETKPEVLISKFVARHLCTKNTKLYKIEKNHRIKSRVQK